MANAKKEPKTGTGPIFLKRPRSASGGFDPRQIPGPVKMLKLDGKTVSVLVGKSDPKEYIVHDILLTSHSEFFRTALHSDFKEGQERAVKMPDDDPKVFDIYMQWLYRGVITYQPLTEPTQSPCDYHLLVRAYTFGDKVLDRDFQDAIMDAILAGSQELNNTSLRVLPTGATIDYIYQTTLPGSPMRKLMRDHIVYYGVEDWMPNVQDANRAYLLDIVKDFLRTRNLQKHPPPDLNSNTCEYHLHKRGDECYQMRFR